MLHRTPANGNFWQGVTGGVEDGEELIKTARRELREETQIKPTSIQQLDYKFTFANEGIWKERYNWKVKTIPVYTFRAIAESSAEPVLESGEHDKYIWCGYEKAVELLHWDKDKEALRHCELTFS